MSDALLSDEDASSLTEAQDKALSLIPLFSGLLSAYGSTCIILAVWRSREESTCYKRIMLGLSCCDWISSTALSLQAFLLPADTSPRIWAIGTDATCSMMGFFQQLSFSNVWYNGMLSFYFLWTIKYGVAESKLAAKYEPWMHGLSIGFPLITASVLAAMDQYAELKVGHFCWIAGENAALIAYLVAGIPNFFFLLAIPVNNFIVYRHVKHSIHQNDVSANRLSNEMTAGSPHESDGRSNESKETRFSNEQQMLDQGRERERQREVHRQQQRSHRQNQRLRAVAFQAFLYVAAFLASQLPTVVLRILAAALRVTSADEARFFPLLVIQAILLPLQGLFNWVIFARSSTYVRET